MADITINGITIDPTARSADLSTVEPASPDASSSNYLLVQTDGPLSEEGKRALADLGAVIQEYIPEDTYLCSYPPVDLAIVRDLPEVVWADVYLGLFKISPRLRPPALSGLDPIAAAGASRSPSRLRREVDVVLHAGVDPASDLVGRIAAAARIDPTGLQVGRRKVRLTTELGSLPDIAELDEVRQIEEVPARQLFNNVARKIIDADVLVNGTAYRGGGQIVTVADTGFDQGSTTATHPAFTGRVAKLYALGRPTPAQADDPDGHGTHVAGSVLGDGMSASMGGAIQGTAPEATLILQSVLDAGGGVGGIPFDLHDLFQPPYDDGARVHTNSWGIPVPGLPYDASSQEIDDFVWEHPDQVICFAAGNDASDTDADGVVDPVSVGSQSAAKNAIIVGASESVRDFRPSYGTYWPGDFPADPIRRDPQANNAHGMVAFSSRGPTQEGRIKPDVVAPGTCILSTLSRAVATPSTVFGTSSDPDYFFSSGTSMATPLVAGCVAVLRETLVENGVAEPTAALVKALLINGAVPLAGQYVPTEAGTSPNGSSGFGRVNLAGSVIIPGVEVDAGFVEGGPLAEGDQDTIEVSIPERRDDDEDLAAAGSATFKVTLVWSDPPGAGLQNDLDLIVIAADGSERHGNMGTGDGFDRANNVEQVVWENMPPGAARIVVRAFRITRFAQPYAFAWRIS